VTDRESRGLASVHVWQPVADAANQKSRLTEAEDDAGLGEVVGRHFHLHTVANNESDEALAHLSRYVRQNLVTTRELYPEHRACQNRRNFSFHLYRFFFVVGIRSLFWAKISIASAPARSAASGIVSRWHNVVREAKTYLLAGEILADRGIGINGKNSDGFFTEVIDVKRGLAKSCFNSQFGRTLSIFFKLGF